MTQSLLTTDHENISGRTQHQTPRRALTFTQRLLLSLVFFVQIALGYFLMLIAMTFNVGLFLAIVFGFTIGYFVFMDTQAPAKDGAETVCH